MKHHTFSLAAAIGTAAILFTFVGAVASEDEQSATDKAASERQIVLLRAEITLLRDTLEQRNKEIKTLKEEIELLKARGTHLPLPAEPVVEPSPPQPVVEAPAENPPAEKLRVVELSAKAYSALPKGTATGKPLGFTDVKVGEVGFVNVAKVLRILDDTSAIVEDVLVEKGTGVLVTAWGQPVSRRFIIEEISTKDQADGSGWPLWRWFKITGTKQVGGTTYFVAHPIVQADNTLAPRRTGSQR